MTDETFCCNLTVDLRRGAIRHITPSTSQLLLTKLLLTKFFSLRGKCIVIELTFLLQSSEVGGKSRGHLSMGQQESLGGELSEKDNQNTMKPNRREQEKSDGPTFDGHSVTMSTERTVNRSAASATPHGGYAEDSKNVPHEDERGHESEDKTQGSWQSSLQVSVSIVHIISFEARKVHTYMLLGYGGNAICLRSHREAVQGQYVERYDRRRLRDVIWGRFTTDHVLAITKVDATGEAAQQATVYHLD
ncbi:hypothetical protein PROFUN_15024 [Planoprotostelium fungivorum]|uniref:Uncharacterized protein n=1 Tax=Planoprotostelium fungivorum TaxID=1890364 RepID=A0A2P6MXV8_9EUKA|nr:hypothetical protein PROFUN_15024 [Planoprotostelium fungivorum]